MISYFNEQVKSFGVVKEHKTITITFQATNDIPEVVNVSYPCGCNKGSKYDEATKTLIVVYKSGFLSKQTPFRQSINKQIIVTYNNNVQEIITITGVKIKE